MKILPKIVVVLGPTASGKSSLGEAISLEFGGEIISADSRQVYRGLDLGTGKEQLKIKQHLIDIADPEERMTVVKWRRQAELTIKNLLAAKKLPVVVGGSSLYVSALVDNYRFAPEDTDGLRERLSKRDLTSLYQELKERDPAAATKLGPNNKRYLIRALERLTLAGKAVPAPQKPKYNALLIGRDLPRAELYRRIDRRVDERLKQGMLAEVKNLLDSGVSADWLISLGLEYKYLTEHLTGVIPDQKTTVSKLKFATHYFARRQLIWWRRRSDIHWLKTDSEAIKLVKKFLVDR